ncbi:MAG: DUF885 domain-containing protein [Pseudomonadota bacterium]
MHKPLTLAAALLLTACVQEDAPSAPLPAEENAVNEAAEEFQRVLEEHWALRMREDPVLASELGNKGGAGQLGNPSLAAFDASTQARAALIEKLGAIDTNRLVGDDALNHRLLTVSLQRTVDRQQELIQRYLIINTYSAPHSSLARLADRTSLRSEDDAASYKGRLQKMPGYIDDVIARLDEAVELGWTQPCEAMVGFERTYRTHIVDDAETSVFFAPYVDSPYRDEEALELIQSEIIPAFERFGSFYEERYAPNCRKDVGVGSLDGGAEAYEAEARAYTTTDLSADAIHNLGLSEVARIRAEMEGVAAEAGFDSLPAFQEHLRTSPEYYPKSAEERMQKAARIAKTMDGKLVQLFRYLPRMPYDIKPIPMDTAEGTTTAYYSRPSPDFTRPGTYWLNTTRLSTRPLYELEALTLHEAVPGHHLQIAIAQERDLPKFRRFGSVTAYTEGWGLYSERLGLEVGFYTTPETNFGRLSYEMWRACRLVVDTGMHSKGWTRGQAIEFMLENTGLSRNNIEREVDRYITWPGQALAYKIGELKIRELRAEAEETLGGGFDIREFHDVVLRQGPIPLDVLDEVVTAWVDEGGSSE